MCIAEGRALHKFRNQLLGHQKLLTTKGTVERTLLKGGFLVWMLRGSPREPLFAGLAAADDDSSGGIDEDLYVFWHIAFVLLNPYQPVMHIVDCESTDRGEKPVPHTELAVKAIQ